MNEKQLAEIKEKTQAIVDEKKKLETKLTLESIKKLDINKDSHRKSIRSKLSGSESAGTHVIHLEKELEEEREARKKMEVELKEIKKMLSTLSKR